jgi:hypothetical protein
LRGRGNAARRRAHDRQYNRPQLPAPKDGVIGRRLVDS